MGDSLLHRDSEGKRRVGTLHGAMRLTKAEKARRIGKILGELYPQTPVPLDSVDPYTLLVAVLLSAQTTDARVNQVTPGLFARASTPEAMARLPVEAILEEIRTCGLAPSKAKNIRRLCGSPSSSSSVTGARSLVPSRSWKRSPGWDTRRPAS
jgi:hypothetical protein